MIDLYRDPFGLLWTDGVSYWSAYWTMLDKKVPKLSQEGLDKSTGL